MADLYTYQKKRKDLGMPCDFKETPTENCTPQVEDQQAPQYSLSDFIVKNPNFIEFDNIQELSEHQVNTERVKTKDKGMYHKEGGWPSTTDANVSVDVARYKKKVERSEQYMQAVKDVCQQVERCVEQNNQIDLFEEYFAGEQSEHQVENLTSKTIMLFKDDQTQYKRSVSEISWHPEGPQKLAASYAINRFQKMPEGMATKAHIWDLSNPNQPSSEIHTVSPVTNIMYNPKQTDILGYGCYNGLLGIWDCRKNTSAISITQQSHYDPVTHFNWMTSRTGTEFVSTSTDGSVMWWDTRKFEEPVEKLLIHEGTQQILEDPTKAIGGTVLEYNIDAGPNKLLIGTELGSIITTNKRPKKPVEFTNKYGIDENRHLGPIYSIHRSPVAKYFLSVGDWSCRIWVEELKTPIIRTRYHHAQLSDGCWSPTRNGVFFLTRRDGWLDVWDYYYRQNEIAYSHKVSETALTCIKINKEGQQSQSGKLVAIGDQDGTVTILELCDSLYIPQTREKDTITEMFDREFRKEKTLLENKKRAGFVQKGGGQQDTEAKQKAEKEKMDARIKVCEDRFNAMLEQYKKEQEEAQHQEFDSPTQKKKQIDEQDEQDDEAEDQQQEQQADQGEKQADDVQLPPLNEGSYLKKHLTTDLYKEYKDKDDGHGFLFSKVISGNDGIDLIMGSHECYSAYKKLVDLIVQDLYQYEPEAQYASNLAADQIQLDEIDAELTAKIETQHVVFSRNVDGHKLLPALDADQKKTLQDALKEAANSCDTFTENTDKGYVQLLNADKNLTVDLNNDNHLTVRIEYTNKYNLKQAFTDAVEFLNKFQEKHKFQQDPHFGYVGSSLYNVGHSIDIKLVVNHEGYNQDKANEVAEQNNVKLEQSDGKLHLSTKQQFSKTEVELIGLLNATLKDILTNKE